jgi:thiol-disulfide isomerase/thioredoxin
MRPAGVRSMSRLCSAEEISKAAQSKDGVYVLFYADWCPFSRAFLPVFEKQAEGREADFLRVLLEGHEPFFDECEIKVYPTVLFFRAGRVHRRLDGKLFVGLSEKQLVKLVESCDKGRSKD